VRTCDRTGHCIKTNLPGAALCRKLRSENRGPALPCPRRRNRPPLVSFVHGGAIVHGSRPRWNLLPTTATVREIHAATPPSTAAIKTKEVCLFPAGQIRRRCARSGLVQLGQHRTPRSFPAAGHPDGPGAGSPTRIVRGWAPPIRHRRRGRRWRERRRRWWRWERRWRRQREHASFSPRREMGYSRNQFLAGIFQTINLRCWALP
jgi:hypothetical protein